MSTSKGKSGSINLSIKNYSGLIKDIQKINKEAENVVTKTVSDFKSRAPAWVSAAVTETYGISKSDVKGAFTGAKKSAGTIKASGNEVDNIGLVYKGRVLTPTHFKMKPKTKPEGNKPYQVTAEIYKGKRKVLSSIAFLADNRGGGYIPFQRKGKARLPVESIKTVSVPQMIENKDVAAKVGENIEAGLGKRVEHHLNQALKHRS